MLGEDKMLAEKLKQARVDKGYSQDEVADRLKISRPTISKWENGKAYPDLYNFKLLCNLYDLPADSLLKDDEKFKDLFVQEEEKDEDITKEQMEREAYNKKLEMLFMIVVMLAACLIPFLGVAVSLVVLIHILKKPDEVTIAVKLIMVVCLVVSLMNSFILLNEMYFHIGEATIM